MSAVKPLQLGDVAPDFALPDISDKIVRLSDFRGTSDVVLFFYPKDNSPVCTAQACSFRDNFEDFQQVGATVIGISGDSEGSHRLFARLWKLPFVLLSDKRGEVRNRYGVPRTLGIFPGRVTYLIDREGIVRHIVSSALQPGKHVTEMLRKIGEMKAAATGNPDCP